MSYSSRRLCNQPPQPSPVEEVLKTLPKGNGDWPGFDSVWSRMQASAQKLANNKITYLGELHIQTMAVLGCGHEETMKHHMLYLLDRGYYVSNKDALKCQNPENKN